MRNVKTGIVVGTRPEIIKMSPIIKLFEKNNSSYFVVHTGQHYTFNLDKIFFRDLQLPEPKYNLEVGSGSQSKQTAKILSNIEDVFNTEKPDLILVQGDTNSVLAGALAGVKCGYKVGHVEAGLRSYDRTMPEEINRVVTDHISDYLYAPTEISRKILLNEGLDSNKIFVTGNTVVDSLINYIEIARSKSNIIDKLKLSSSKYCLATFHRPSNVDYKKKLKNIFEALAELANIIKCKIIVPVHPRTRKMIKKYGIKCSVNYLKLIDPVSYLDFLLLENNAELILTDSGGVQEEACVLKVPCVTLRKNTERPETVDIGANSLVGTDKKLIIEHSLKHLRQKRDWKNPYGDGRAAEIIIKHIKSIG